MATRQASTSSVSTTSLVFTSVSSMVTGLLPGTPAIRDHDFQSAQERCKSKPGAMPGCGMCKHVAMS